MKSKTIFSIIIAMLLLSGCNDADEVAEEVAEEECTPAPLPTDTTAADTTFVLCLVSTAQTGEPDTPRRLEDSNIRFLRPDWSPLDSLAVPFYLPPFTSFIEGQAPDSLRATYDSALRSLDSFHPVRLALSAESTTLTATLQPAYLAKDEREAITPYLRPLTFIWNGTNFAVEP